LALILGVSSGLFSVTGEAEKQSLIGFYKKAQSCITKGVEFVQVDLESVAEFEEPYLKENMEGVKRLGITFGVHSETAATGVEIAELDSAIETDYKFGHERLQKILEKAGELGSKYVLIHASESESFISLERHMQPAILVDFFGNPLRKFLEDNRKILLDWLLGGTQEEVANKIITLVMEKTPAERKGISEEELKKIFTAQDFIWREILNGHTFADAIRRTIINKISEIESYNIKKNYENVNKGDVEDIETRRYIEDSIRKEIRESLTFLLDFIQSRSLHYGPERIAYYFVARYMEKTNDPLWKDIINSTVKYWAKSENKTVEEWLNSKGIKSLELSDPNFQRYSYIWVPAVSAKYIWGHLRQDKNTGPNKYTDYKPILRKYKMPLVLETPMARRGVEQWLRLANPIQMYYLAKDVGSDYVQLAIDLEHMLSVRVDPDIVIDLMPEDGGKFVRVIHAGYPSTLAPAHMQIPLGSEQQVYLYKIYYNLWKRGMGKDNECFLVFERGAPESMQQSIVALKLIKEFIEKNVDPSELLKHPEFFGIGVADLQRQVVTIREHARDPLKGLLVVPEEEYTSLGRAATEKGIPPEKWKKEELR
jgi:sugar phosphate isomerase/epimerase